MNSERIQIIKIGETGPWRSQRALCGNVDMDGFWYSSGKRNKDKCKNRPNRIECMCGRVDKKGIISHNLFERFIGIVEALWNRMIDFYF